MQAFRKSVAASVVFAFAIGSTALAAPRQEDPKESPRSREARKAQKPSNPWIGTVVTILDELQGWLSIPPG
jgi:hypothetical protein